MLMHPKLQMTSAQIGRSNASDDGVEALKGILDESYLKNVNDNSLIKMQDEYKARWYIYKTSDL